MRGAQKSPRRPRPAPEESQRAAARWNPKHERFTRHKRLLDHHLLVLAITARPQ